MTSSGCPVLVLMSPDEQHPFDAYLEEILLVEGFNCHTKRIIDSAATDCSAMAADFSEYPLVLISSGAASHLSPEAVTAYIEHGGRAVIFQPPREWAPHFGLAPATALYATSRDAYLQINTTHPWLADFPAADLQVPGEAHVYGLEEAQALAFVAGQRGRPSIYPAAALHRRGSGAAVVFTYDLAETVVLLHQGRPEKSSTGSDPDANRDGKFTADDAFEGMRDYALRHVPQADVHQDLLVRVLRGLAADGPPLPRLWHFPKAAPALLFIDGDGDSMIWEDLEWVVREMAETGARYTLYLMTPQIEAFDSEKIAALRAQGHEFGVHPWICAQPDLDTWRECVSEIVTLFRERFGFPPRALRAHSCIFPGWDENPQLLAECGLRLDTDFAGGYRFVSGYLNGSAQLVKFISRDGRIIDCYSQNTVQTEDGSCTPKCLLPPMDEHEATALALQLLDECTHRWHGVFHPYFHPIALAGRSKVACQNWFRQVLRRAKELGLPSVNAGEWLDFNDARRAVGMEVVHWDGETLVVALQTSQAVAGLTLMLPPWCAEKTLCARVGGEARELLTCDYEGLRWLAVVLDLPAQSRTEITVAPC